MTPKVKAAQDLAVKLMTDFRLFGWWFKFNRSKRRMGLCRWPWKGKEGIIELSMYYVEMNEPAEVDDTIRHEIAHALTSHKDGHGPKWIEMCKVTGAKPLPCGFAKMPKGKYRAVCPNCSLEFERYRKPKATAWHCVKCGPETGQLTWNS